MHIPTAFKPLKNQGTNIPLSLSS